MCEVYSPQSNSNENRVPYVTSSVPSCAHIWILFILLLLAVICVYQNPVVIKCVPLKCMQDLCCFNTLVLWIYRVPNSLYARFLMALLFQWFRVFICMH